MLWNIEELAPRGEREHQCEEAKKHSLPEVFEAKHEGLYVPVVGGGVRIFFEKGEWVFMIADEFGLAISHCPFCGEHLV